jgi:hypothetical protein
MMMIGVLLGLPFIHNFSLSRTNTTGDEKKFHYGLELFSGILLLKMIEALFCSIFLINQQQQQFSAQMIDAQTTG